MNNGVSSDKANINAQNKPGADISKYEEFLQSHPKGHFMQSPQWAEVKSFWKNEIVTVEDENGNIKGAMSLLIRKIPILPYTMMYLAEGTSVRSS